MTSSDIEIAPGFTKSGYEELNLHDNLSAGWEKAISAFQARFKTRYFVPIDRIIKAETPALSSAAVQDVNGFIVLSVSFMLLETLEGFRRGKGSHNGCSRELCVDFLKRMTIEGADTETRKLTPDEADYLYSNGRCALLHAAGTEGIRVKKSGPAIRSLASGEFEINRTCFYGIVKSAFDAYACDLRKAERPELRKNFRKKMDFICDVKDRPASTAKAVPGA